MTSKWATTLSGGKSADDYIREHTDYTDKEIADILAEQGFKTTAGGIRGRRTRIKVIKVQGGNRRNQQVIKESHKKNGDIWSVELDNSRIASQDEFIEKYHIDQAEWEITEFLISYHETPHSEKATGDSTFWMRDDGDMKIALLTNIKATLKRKKEVSAAREEILNFIHSQPFVKLKTVKYRLPKTGNMLEVSPMDAHFGKLGWHEETLGGDYDLKIAKARFTEAIDGLLSAASAYKYDKIVFVIGHDLFNSDNIEGTTTAGTSQNNDSRIQKVYRVVQESMIETIDKLRQIAPVQVKIVPGNHDTLLTWTLGQVLGARYAKDKSVEIDNAASLQKFFEWGKVGLMFIHGDKGKRDEYPQLMATQVREMWGRTLFNEIHTGHLHKVKADEKYGVVVRILPSLTEPDAWHAGMGFVNNLMRSEAYAYNKERGLLGIFVHTHIQETNHQ